MTTFPLWMTWLNPLFYSLRFWLNSQRVLKNKKWFCKGLWIFVWNSFGDPSSPVGKRESGTVEYHSESEGFCSKSHWCTWPGFGTQTDYEASRDLRVKPSKRQNWWTLPLCQWLKIVLWAAKYLITNIFAKSKSVHQSNIY